MFMGYAVTRIWRVLWLIGACALASAAPALDLDRLSVGERAKLDAEFERFLRDHPDLLLDLVSEALEARQNVVPPPDPDLIEANRAAIYDDDYSWRGGNPAGDVVIVEFSDYRCPYCRQMYDIVREVVEEDGQILHIVKEFPILGEISVLAAAVAVTIRMTEGEDAYAALRKDWMTADQAVGQTALEPVLEQFDERAHRVIEQDGQRAIMSTIELAEALYINGTPAFIVGDRILRGIVSTDELKEHVLASREGTR